MALRHREEIERIVGPVGIRRSIGLWRPWIWFLLLALVLAAYGLAAWYLQGNKLPACTPKGPHPCGNGYAGVVWWERLVDSLKVFPSGIPGYDDTQVWQYNLARYIGAGVFLLASF